MLIRLNPEKYLQLGTDIPEHEMVWSGWKYDVHWFLWSYPYIIYSKDLFR